MTDPSPNSEGGDRRKPAARRPSYESKAPKAGQRDAVGKESTRPGPAELNTATYRPGEGEQTRLPENFGRYLIERALGEGGMGSVYLARDRELGRAVAIKIPNFKVGGDPALLERFHREARVAATLQHPNICPVYDSGIIDGIPYLAMAYVEGKPLSHFLARDRIVPGRQIAALVRKVALALEEAHTRGIVHRDLKPSNVMIRGGKEPIVTDFGLAQVASPGDARLTASGTVLGTPAYMSPEQVKGEMAAIGPRSDIYSLGVMLYEMLAGRLPFNGVVPGLFVQIVNDTPAPPSAYRSGVDPVLERICLKAMAKAADDRFESMAALAAALKDYLLARPALPGASTFASQSVPADDDFLAALANSATTATGRAGAGAGVGVDERSRVGRGVLFSVVVVGVAVAALGWAIWFRADRPIREPAAVAKVAAVPGPAVAPAPALDQSIPAKETKEPEEATEAEAEVSPIAVPSEPEPEETTALAAVSPSPPIEKEVESSPEKVAPATFGTIAETPEEKPAPARAKRAARRDATSKRKGGRAPNKPGASAQNSLGMSLVSIPPGFFERGSTQGQPPHRVVLTKPFRMSAHEVTVGQFRKFVEATGYRTEAEASGIGGKRWDEDAREWKDDPAITWRTPGFPQSDDHPVIVVSWTDAMKFCRWLEGREKTAYRLPTEAEWEYACRGGTRGPFWSGEDTQLLARTSNFADATLRAALKSAPAEPENWSDGFAFTAPVGQFLPNPFGLFDVHGNVSEWCLDVSYDDYANRWTDIIDPEGPIGPNTCRHRGGNFLHDCWNGGSAAVWSDWRSVARTDRGFRIVASLPDNIGDSNLSMGSFGPDDRISIVLGQPDLSEPLAEVVWVRDRIPFQVALDLERPELDRQSRAWRKKGFRPTGISGYSDRAGDLRFAATWLRDDVGTVVEIGLDAAAMQARFDAAQPGTRPIWLNTYVEGEQERFTLILAEDPAAPPWRGRSSAVNDPDWEARNERDGFSRRIECYSAKGTAQVFFRDRVAPFTVWYEGIAPYQNYLIDAMSKGLRLGWVDATGRGAKRRYVHVMLNDQYFAGWRVSVAVPLSLLSDELKSHAALGFRPLWINVK